MIPDTRPMGPTVREALALWRLTLGKGGSAYDAPTLDIVFDPRLPPLRVRNPGFTHWHDLHHVALGAGLDFYGEVEVAAWELVTGAPTWAVWRLDVMGVVTGLLGAPRLTLRTIWRAWRGRNLYGRTDYEAVLDWSVGELRAYMAGQ